MPEEIKEEKIKNEKELEKLVDEEVEKQGLNRDEAENVKALLNTVGGMNQRQRTVVYNTLFAAGGALIGAGATFLAGKALGYGLVKKGSRLPGYADTGRTGDIDHPTTFIYTGGKK